MKQQISLTLAIVLMASSVFANGPRGTNPGEAGPVKSARDKAREEALKRGVRPETSAPGQTRMETAVVRRSSILSQFAGLGPSSPSLELFESRTFRTVVNKPGVDGAKGPTETVEFKGKEIFDVLELALKKASEGDPEIGPLRETGVKQAIQLTEMVQQRILPEANNLEVLKWVRDYAQTLNDPRSTAADIQGYAVGSKAMLEYASSNPKEFLHEIYEKAIDPEARRRQKDCTEG